MFSITPQLVHNQKDNMRLRNQNLRDVTDPFLIPSERFAYKFKYIYTGFIVCFNISRFIELYRLPPSLAIQFINELEPLVEEQTASIPFHLQVNINIFQNEFNVLIIFCPHFY